jgi:hypothetical protein
MGFNNHFLFNTAIAPPQSRQDRRLNPMGFKNQFPTSNSMTAYISKKGTIMTFLECVRTVVKLSIFAALLLAPLPTLHAAERIPNQSAAGDGGAQTTKPPAAQAAAPDAGAILVEQMPGDTWDDKIRNAINRACASKGSRTVGFPAMTIDISRTIKLWRQVRTATADTRCEGVDMRDIRQVWASVKGGAPQHIPKGVTLQGTAGATILRWTGGSNQVMLDMPAPWHATVRGISFDGNNTEGLIGLRYRAGWEFGLNGGKLNLFENLSFQRMDIGVEVGDMFCPDLVASTFARCSWNAARIGIRLVGANVAEMWFKNGLSTHLEEATFQMVGFGGRVVRSLAEKDAPAAQNVLRDADGKEIFLEQIPERCLSWNNDAFAPVRQAAGGDDPGHKSRPTVGGGGPTSFISEWVSHNNYANAWFIESNGPAVRAEHIRCEGCAGVLRMTGRGRSNVRFNDMLVDVNATTTGNSSGYAIWYETKGPLLMVGGVLEGPVGLGKESVWQVMGARFENSQRKHTGYLREGETLPEPGFFKISGKTDRLPLRQLPGQLAESKTHERVGFMQLPGTKGARVMDAFGGHAILTTEPAK